MKHQRSSSFSRQTRRYNLTPMTAQRLKKSILPAVLAATALLLSCGGEDKAAHCIIPEGTEFKEGDVVLRRGTGVTSRAVTMADGGSDYSHCGIVTDTDGRKMVVHAVPGEPDYEGDADRVKREPVEEFFSSLKATKGCVMRCADSTAAARSAAKAIELYRRRVLFDHDYDDGDTTKMYCSEFVEYVFTSSGMPLTGGRRHDVSLPGLKFSHVIFPSDFVKSARLRRITSF